jgi:hypothetical protein
MARPTAQQMSFADLELLRQGVRLEPLLQAICDFLDKQPALVDRVRRDLVRGLKRPAKGRRGLTAPQVLRALVLMRLKNWDYRELRERIADGITLRAFTDFYCEKVPKHDAFNRSFNRLTPATLKAVNDLVVEAAVQLGLEDGSKLRVDTTVVETDIHHPTDNTLLWDVVRVLTRLLHRLAKALELRRIEGFRDRRRAAHRRNRTFDRQPDILRLGLGEQCIRINAGDHHEIIHQVAHLIGAQAGDIELVFGHATGWAGWGADVVPKGAKGAKPAQTYEIRLSDPGATGAVSRGRDRRANRTAHRRMRGHGQRCRRHRGTHGRPRRDTRGTRRGPRDAHGQGSGGGLRAALRRRSRDGGRR